MFVLACSTAPIKAPVLAEPTDRVLDTAECAEVGNIDPDSFGKSKVDGSPYGRTHARIDLERGAVVKVDIMDSSPKKLFDCRFAFKPKLKTDADLPLGSGRINWL